MTNPKATDERFLEESRQDEARKEGQKILAEAIAIFAPDLAAELARRWSATNREQEEALEDFLVFLRRSKT